VTNSRCPSKHDGDSSGRDTQSRRRVRQRAKAEEDEDMRGLYRAGVVQLLTRARDEEAGRQLRVKMRKLKASNVFLWPVVAPTTELEEAAVTSSSIIRAAGRQGGQEGLDKDKDAENTEVLPHRGRRRTIRTGLEVLERAAFGEPVAQPRRRTLRRLLAASDVGCWGSGGGALMTSKRMGSAHVLKEGGTWDSSSIILEAE